MYLVVIRGLKGDFIHCKTLRVSINEKLQLFHVTEESVKVRWKYGVFLGFRHM